MRVRSGKNRYVQFDGVAAARGEALRAYKGGAKIRAGRAGDGREETCHEGIGGSQAGPTAGHGPQDI
jgi:hypothetical protein